MDASKLLPKAKEVTINLLPRPSSFRDSLLVFDGVSVISASCGFSVIALVSTLLVAPELWPILLPTLLLSLAPLVLIRHPTSFFFHVVYNVNLIGSIVFILSNMALLLPLVFASDESFVSTFVRYESIDAEGIKAMRIMLIFVGALSSFLSYISIVALRDVKERVERKARLPQ